MEIIVGTRRTLSLDLLDKLASYRYKVFVEHLGWKLNSPVMRELDQFDRPDTVYLIAINSEGSITGCARLLQTTSPYLLGDVFPHLLHSHQPPHSEDIWELSRFAAMDFSGRRRDITSQFSSPEAVRLLREAIAYAARHGVRRLITVSPVGVKRLLRQSGFPMHPAGSAMIIDGHHLFACWVEIPEPNASCNNNVMHSHIAHSEKSHECTSTI